jgi:hypothetical protein
VGSVGRVGAHVGGAGTASVADVGMGGVMLGIGVSSVDVDNVLVSTSTASDLASAALRTVSPVDTIAVLFGEHSIQLTKKRIH